jgi:hypothetical protein
MKIVEDNKILIIRDLPVGKIAKIINWNGLNFSHVIRVDSNSVLCLPTLEILRMGSGNSITVRLLNTGECITLYQD